MSVVLVERRIHFGLQESYTSSSPQPFRTVHFSSSMMDHIVSHHLRHDDACDSSVKSGCLCRGLGWVQLRRESCMSACFACHFRGEHPAKTKSVPAMPCMMGRIGQTLFCAHSTNSSKLMSLHKARIPVCQRPVLTCRLEGQHHIQLDAITGIMHCLLDDKFLTRLHSCPEASQPLSPQQCPD